jgi:hypothetical protein
VVVIVAVIGIVLFVAPSGVTSSNGLPVVMHPRNTKTRAYSNVESAPFENEGFVSELVARFQYQAAVNAPLAVTCVFIFDHPDVSGAIVAPDPLKTCATSMSFA